MIEILLLISNMSSEHSGSCCRPVSQAACQDLNEMDFERGIWSAALNGELKRITEMLNKGIDPSMPDRYGFTALHYAARNGKIEACQLLLKKNANVNAQTNFGATPLHRAAYQGQTEICKLLLDQKANPLIADSDGKTPLHKAAENGHLNVVKLLIEKDANLKYVRDKSFRVPQDYVDPDKNKELYDILFYFEEAAENDHLNIVKLLMEKDPNLKYVRDKSFRVAQDYVQDPDKNKELYDILFHFDFVFE